MGQAPDADIKSLAFKVLERTRIVPPCVSSGTTNGTEAKNSEIRVDRSYWTSDHCLEVQRSSIEKYGHSHAILFPLIGKRVSTPRGSGRLETVYAKRCEVVLDCEPGRMFVFHPVQIGALI